MPLLDALLLDPSPIDIYIAYRKDQIFGSGTMEDPWDGSTAAKLDNILSTKIPSTGNVTIHLGPAPSSLPFLTSGYYEIPGSPGGGGWQLRKGVRIVGSGIDVTVLKVTGVLASSNRHYFAIGHDLTTNGVTTGPTNPVDYAEVSDLTIDCGLPPASDGVACGAIRLMGSNVVLRSVKAVNWGNRVANKVGFVFAMLTGNPDTTPVTSVTNSVMEKCLAINPSVPSSGALTFSDVLIFHAGGKDHDTTQLEAFGVAPVIRDCFLNAEDPNAPGVIGTGSDYRSKFRGLSMASCSAGVVEDNIVMNCWTGGPYLAKWSARSLMVRNNSYRNVAFGPYISYGTGGVSTARVIASASATGNVAQITTSVPHQLAVGDRVLISNVTPSGYNGLFIVTSLVSSFIFQYTLLTSGLANGTGASMQAQKVLGVEKLVIDGNVVELAPFSSGTTPIGIFMDAPSAALVAPAYMFGDVLLEDNKFRYLDGSTGSLLGYGTDTKGCRGIQVERSLVDVIPTNPLRSGPGASFLYNNNRTPSGALVQGYSYTTQALFNELETDNDLSLLMNSFNHKP